ncbi:hypothetical protein CDL15_Pgr018576 [Punica granatum]|uniref:Uncharacterized protein n=1 Tax=Punica granatum TaxID=22663 RepID=A0A218WZ03_PUNGR|nr:hypothetical protein CDL15_Pgr018576 [Punica granatum]PKI42178.1 hypothetical protein CRG98_037417 [Punica granatum]
MEVSCFDVDGLGETHKDLQSFGLESVEVEKLHEDGCRGASSWTKKTRGRSRVISGVGVGKSFGGRGFARGKKEEEEDEQ